MPKRIDPLEKERRRLLLLEWRRTHGITQAQAAKLLTYSESTVKDYEHGRVMVPDAVLAMIDAE